MSVSLFLFCKWALLHQFFRFYLYALIYDICFSCFWPNSFYMSVSKSIHISTSDPVCSFFMYHIFVHSSVDEHIVCFHVLAIVNSTAVNIWVHVSFWIMLFSGYMPCSWIARSCGSSIFNFLSNFHTVLHSVCIKIYSHQQWVPFSSHLLQLLWFVNVMVMAILTSVRWYLIVVLIYISLIICDLLRIFLVFVGCLYAVTGLFNLISSRFTHGGGSLVVKSYPTLATTWTVAR